MLSVTPKSRDGLSICIPNWNHRNYLPRSVASALATSKALKREGIECEILVFDDASRDGSQRLLLSMAMADESGVLQAVLLDRNQGLSAVRNEAMVRARFKWICFLDADNDLFPENVPYFYRAARETEAALIYGNLINRTESRVLGLLSNDVIHEGMLHENYIDALCLVDAEEVLYRGGYLDPHRDKQGHEDWELLLHLIMENRQIVFVPMVLGKYHTNEGSMVRESPLQAGRLHRMYNQRKAGLPIGYRSRMYHPDLGYLI